MSDRRPSKPEPTNEAIKAGAIELAHHNGEEWEDLGNVAQVKYRARARSVLVAQTSADLIAAVRAGVESGTIKGKVAESWHMLNADYVKVDEPGTYLVIPVDVGEDR